MPMYQIDREEVGVRYRSYRVLAADEEEAVELTFDQEPDTEYFKQLDGNTTVKAIPDCECGICREYSIPWFCLESDPEDDVYDLGAPEKAWE